MTRRTFLAGAAAVSALAQPDLELPDFSSCGYAGGGVEPPDVPVRIGLKPASGDATARIQAVIDNLAALPKERRGAILLAKGSYEIGGTLRISANGIVLRGEGHGEGGTTLFAAGAKPRALVEIRGANRKRLLRRELPFDTYKTDLWLG
jgi:pectin methylesterase-like acyl-CoA thioesterase